MTSAIPNPETTHSCMACGSHELDLAFEVADVKKRSFHYYSCSSCGTLQLPHYTDEVLDYAYGQDYYGCETQKFKWPFSLVFSASKFSAALRYAKFLPRTGGDALDVGVGHGGFLKALGRIKKDAKLVGNDIHKSVLIPDEIEFVSGAFETSNFADKRFDLITLFHVFEHLPNPGFVLDKLAGLLKENGHLVISIPNVSSKQYKSHGPDWFHLDPPRHLHLIPPNQLIDLCQAHGLKLSKSSSASIFYNPFSNIQSFLNRYLEPRDVFYEWLKVGGGDQEGKNMRTKRAVSMLAAMTTFPYFMMVDFARKKDETATIELVFKKA